MRGDEELASLEGRTYLILAWESRVKNRNVPLVMESDVVPAINQEAVMV
jgi:hypothetical protein